MQIEAIVGKEHAGRFPELAGSYKVQAVINADDWEDGVPYLLVVRGHQQICFLVYAYSESDALDEFVDDVEFGHMIIDEDADKTDFDENQSYAGNESRAVNLDHVYVFRCAEVIYGADAPIREEDRISNNRAAFKKFNENWLKNGKEDANT